MAQIGYTLSSEEQKPNDLVRYSRHAEKAGFDFLMISDHFHPWIDQQGQSPFVWSVIGGVAQVTEELPLGTGVTCPLIRIHPAIVAQAAATAACMLPGRFFLGVGGGENLNEHITGQRWPAVDVRHEMLEEAVAVIRKLWSGELESHYGKHYTVENARIYTLPDEPPPIMVAASGSKSVELAGRIGDGLIGLAPEKEITDGFADAGGGGKPRYGQIHVCWADNEDEAKRTAHKWWPNTAVPSKLNWELPLPSHFEAAAESVEEDDVAESVVCGPDPEPYGKQVEEFVEAGYDHVYFHQIGPDQEGFLQFYERELQPALRDKVAA
jgi:G6PDH family F420-dependent oxidoreductase